MVIVFVCLATIKKHGIYMNIPLQDTVFDAGVGSKAGWPCVLAVQMPVEPTAGVHTAHVSAAAGGGVADVAAAAAAARGHYH